MIDSNFNNHHGYQAVAGSGNEGWRRSLGEGHLGYAWGRVKKPASHSHHPGEPCLAGSGFCAKSARMSGFPMEDLTSVAVRRMDYESGSVAGVERTALVLGGLIVAWTGWKEERFWM